MYPVLFRNPINLCNQMTKRETKEVSMKDQFVDHLNFSDYWFKHVFDLKHFLTFLWYDRICQLDINENGTFGLDMTLRNLKISLSYDNRERVGKIINKIITLI